MRVTAAGVKTWTFRYRGPNGGNPSRVSIGRYPDIGLAAAREAADAMRVQVMGGADPAIDRRQHRSGGRAFSVLADRFINEHSRRRKRSHAADQRNLEKHVLPKWGNRNYTTIRRSDVIELCEGLVTAGKPVLANRIQSLISTIYSFALDADLVEANPCHRLRKRGVENAGSRVLSDTELRLFWNAIVAPSRRFGLALRLTLLTGARIGEIAGLCRAELENIESPNGAAWLIPAARVESGAIT